MDDERLIIEVETHNILYDTSNSYYKDNPKKERAWGEIAAVLGVDAKECSNRWRLLRDQYVKCIRKQLESGADAESESPPYKYGDIMSFLRAYIQPRRSKSNLRLPVLAPSRPAWTSTATTASTSVSVRSTPASDGDGDRPVTPSSCSTVPSPVSSNLTAREVERPARSRSPIDRATSRPLQEERRSRRQMQQTQQAPAFRDRLLDVLQEPPPKPPVPETVQDEVYHYALSLVPMMLKLSQGGLRRAKFDILKTLYSIQDEESHAAPTGWAPTPVLRPPPTPTSSRLQRTAPHPQEQTGAIGQYTQMLQENSQWDDYTHL